MGTEPLPSQAQPAPGTAMQHSILQQAEAAVAAQADPAGPTGHETLLQETDLFTLDANQGDLPPPAYGDTYGEIRSEKDGLGTSGCVTDDGRVNIRINQVNRRLSQIFSPALRRQIQAVQDDRPPPSRPPPYVPPFLGGGKAGAAPAPPPLNVVIQVVGSRGDVQPFIALGKVLKGTYGHRVRLATHPIFRDFVREHGLEFFSIGGDPSRLMAFMVKNPSLVPGLRSLMSGDISQRRRDVAEYIQGCWRSCYQAGDGMGSCSDPGEVNGRSESAARPFVADCIIANPPSFAHIHCAEKLGIPLHIMFTMPYSPSQDFPTRCYAMVELLLWQGIGDIINRFRAKCLGLDPVSTIWGPGMLQRLKVPHTYCWSPALLPKPKDWAPHISISGYYFLDSAPDYTPAPELQAFLDAGPPPVYIGFGSIVLDDPNAMTELIFEAVRKTGRRVLLSKGWGGLGADELPIPDGVFLLGNVSHDWLFKHVSCVIHHGGAGTTAAGIAAGRPTLIIPFFGDQPFWGDVVARSGAGPDPIPHKQLTADKLADAISFLLKPETLERAQELASQIAAERGTDMGAQSFHHHLDVDRLRCALAPSRPAAWRVKRTQVTLSAFAACALANANLLDFHDLKLFRSREYYTDEGPWDPISGGFTAFAGAVGGMMMGLADVPSETWRGLQMPAGRSRRQSRVSVPMVASETEASHAGNIPSPPLLPRQSETSPDDSVSRVRSPLNLPSRSSSTSDVGSSSVPGSLQAHLQPKRDDSSLSPSPSRTLSSSGKEPDMLRPTGVHMSRGAGRFVKALVQAPVNISVNLTRGCHNIPKLWGDDTVRPQERVSDVKSGLRAAGREFGFGWYDGVTGLATQPWQGARREGVSGFVKGVGKGGVSKEMEKLFGSNVHSYIVASRVAQGYEDWLQSSDAEKQDVIERWKLIEKYVKKRGDRNEMLRDVLEAQRNQNPEDGEAQHQGHRTTASSDGSATAEAPDLVPESAALDTSDSESSLRPADAASPGLRAMQANGINRLSNQETSQRRVEENSAHQIDQGDVHQTIMASKADFQRHEGMTENAAAAVDGVSTRVWPLDPGHLGGTTRSEFEAQQHMQGQRREKTTQERAEEVVVLEYVKKQSLLEQQYRNKGKGRAVAMEDTED
ncbi:hypothetical protein ACCO45_004979 [Purpureocillium lilacinum]|uniref:Uncharacterized protein n=1 Tax=Purpureocillium lilacinum TaxID=33203 RepID=A0ACC4DUT0_PURLI